MSLDIYWHFYMPEEKISNMNVGVFTTGTDEEARVGKILDDAVVDISAEVPAFDTALERITTGKILPDGGREHRLADVQLLPPTTRENATFAIALNYGSHIEEKSESDTIDEADRDIPETPYFFTKLYRSLVGHDQSIRYHSSITQQLDYAAELAAVVGRPARDVSPEEALDYVAGYTILNDTAAYDIQNISVGDMTWIDWFSAKSMENTTPVGPYVASSDAVGDPHDLSIRSEVNGRVMQSGSTSTMIRGVNELVSFLSTRVTLRPGDVIATGTPEGVGAFQDLALDDGDRIGITIENVGSISNVVEEAD